MRRFSQRNETVTCTSHAPWGASFNPEPAARPAAIEVLRRRWLRVKQLNRRREGIFRPIRSGRNHERAAFVAARAVAVRSIFAGRLPLVVFQSAAGRGFAYIARCSACSERTGCAKISEHADPDRGPEAAFGRLSRV